MHLVLASHYTYESVFIILFLTYGLPILCGFGLLIGMAYLFKKPKPPTPDDEPGKKTDLWPPP